MALRTIRELGDPVLGKRAKEVREMTPKLRQLIADMKETMYEADGVGLAAPQVGMLKRIVVIDVSEEQNQPLVMINPEIIESSGEQFGAEGCLTADHHNLCVGRQLVQMRGQVAHLLFGGGGHRAAVHDDGLGLFGEGKAAFLQPPGNLRRLAEVQLAAQGMDGEGLAHFDSSI